MKKISSTFFLLSTVYCLLLTVFVSCDKIDDPFERKLELIDTTQQITDYTRYVLIEEFTGHTCPNCPDGAREVQRLDSIYGKKLIPVSIHAGYFAKPHNPPNTSYLTDFRTTEGEAYNTTFALEAYPSAMVSRKDNGSGNKVLSKGSWENAIANFVDDTAKVTVSTTNIYDNSQRQLNTKVKIKWLSNDTGSYKLQVYLIEDHITDWQLDGSFDNPNYDHRHVFRKSLNGIWGIDIATSNTNDSATFEYSSQLNASWDENNCEIISFIYHSSTYEVIQANEAAVKE